MTPCRTARALAGLTALCASSSFLSSAHAQLAFTDVTVPLGLDDPTHRHFGLTIVDLNQDGFVDLYYANGLQDPIITIPPTGTCPTGTPVFFAENTNTLYLNNGDGTFGADIAPGAGLDDKWNAMRNVFGDYDNDGLRDLMSHNFIVSPLYHHVGTVDSLAYVDASASSEMNMCLTNGTGASWVDLNRDGYLDLYGTEYDQGRPASAHLSKLFLNDGDGTFTDATVAAGLTLSDNGMGITFCDYDNDGDQDFFVTNSHEATTRLYRHDGLIGGVPQFVDVAVEAGVAVQDSLHRGVGISWGDYNSDGRFDMLFSREGDSRLWRNDGPNGSGVWTFSDMSTTGGINWKFTPAPYGMWGGGFFDLDNDGWLDIVITNRDQGAPNQVYRNNGDETWTEMAASLGLNVPPAAMIGAVGADYDNDGDLDLFLCNHKYLQRNYVLRNDTSPANSWVQFRLTGTTSNRDAVGARIKVTADIAPGSTETQMREILAGSGFFSDIPRIQTFGLGSAAQVTSVTIEWPSGLTQVVGPLAVNQRYDYTESAPVSAPLTAGTGTALLLEPARPNPFATATTVSFGLVREADVRLRVHDVSGRLVRTLADTRMGAGRHDVVWDGTDRSGAPAPPGIYFARFESEGRVESRKLALVR